MSNKPNSSRIAVIGAGPGGYAAAFKAADLGLDVTLIDSEANPGGVCLYRGCIPSKAMLHVAKLIRETEDAKDCGITFAKPIIELDQLRKWKDDIVQKLTGGLNQLCRARGVNYIQGRARYTNSKQLAVTCEDGTEKVIDIDYSVIAVGSKPISIPALDLDSVKVMDSTEALEIPDIPKRLLVIGGGYIGLELGTVYSALGSKVSVVEMTDSLLAGVDRDMVAILEERLRRDFHDIKLSTRVSGMREQKNGIKVEFSPENGPKESGLFDKVLVAIGRQPNSKGLGLENTAVESDERGFIKIDPQRRTHDSSIFAIGDIAGDPMLAHKASHEGHVAVEVIAGKKTVFAPHAIPAVVFTDPEIAWCGITETECKREKRNVRVSKFPWSASSRASTLGRSDGLTKLIADAETERVLGVGICGPGAGELIAEGVLAIEMAALASDLQLVIHPHPTLTETIMESAELHSGSSTHIFRRQRK